nr:reverse transcriptase domain-containing protein [Tanacetum cinerariifolium]
MQTNMTSLTNSNLELKNMFGQFMKMNTASSSSSGTLPGNRITNPKEDLKGITTQSGTAYQGPTIPTTSCTLPPVVERETELTKDMMHPTNNGSTKDVQPLVNQTKTLILNFMPVVAPIIEPIVAPLRRCFILMPKFGPSIKTLLTNKDKLFELARTSLNGHCSTVLLKKLPEKLGDPGKFLIACDFSGMAECLALVYLGASINLMPLSVWNKLSFPELSPTCMTLELVDRLISHPVEVALDVSVKLGTFHFPVDFVVVDFDADPQVPLIPGRSFLKTKRALIDVFKGELTLRVGKEAIIFNLDQTSRYSANYNDMLANLIDVIDMDCEEYSQEVLGYSDVIASGNPTPYYNLIISTSSLTLTPFGDSDFLLEEVDAFLALEDNPTSPKVDHSYVDTEGDILLLEVFLNDDPSLPPPNQGNYLPQVRKELKIYGAKTDKSLIDEPPKVELKDLPPHLKFAFLEGDDKLPVIIEKDLSDEEKTALVTDLKSHKRAIAWKLSDIKDFDADPRVPLILGRSFLKTERALIDVFKGELTLHVGKEAITFNLDQTLRDSSNYNDMTANRIDVIDMACEEYSDFLLEEVNAFLALEDDGTSPEVYQSYFDSEGDILLLDAFLNDDPSLPHPTQGNYLPKVQKELQIYEAKTDKSSIDEPPEVELKDLPPHLEYAFLEGDDKFPVIITKDLSVEEKTALITVLKSHKRAIAWKLSDIKGIDPEFCTHKILMKEDYKPAVQH